MTEPMYTSRSIVEIVRGTHRRVEMEAGGAFETGVHGAIKHHFKLNDEPDLPLPVDYVVGATGAWMLGTLKGALEVRGIPMRPETLRAEVSGTNELIDGIIRLTRITVRYSLRIPAGTRDTVDRALARHREKCPTARSLEAAIAVDWTAEIVEDA